jgi:hypothetical protein
LRVGLREAGQRNYCQKGDQTAHCCGVSVCRMCREQTGVCFVVSGFVFGWVPPYITFRHEIHSRGSRLLRVFASTGTAHVADRHGARVGAGLLASG